MPVFVAIGRTVVTISQFWISQDVRSHKLGFLKFYILTMWTIKKDELRHCAKFCRNRSNHEGDIANPCGAETTWVVWANTWKNKCFGFLGIPFFTLFFGSRLARTRGPILTIYTSYDVFPPKDVPFGGLEISAPITTKFCTVTKTTKYSSWVVPTVVKPIQDGGRPPSWKIENRP